MKPTKDILRDPDFHGLPEIERLKVLYHVDPEYRKMYPRERWKVISKVPTPPSMVDPLKPVPPRPL